MERSISLCTGDTLLYITNLNTSAPVASVLTEELGSASYKISLNTGLWERDSFLWECKTFSHVSWAATSFACSELKPPENSLIYLIKKEEEKKTKQVRWHYLHQYQHTRWRWHEQNTHPTMLTWPPLTPTFHLGGLRKHGVLKTPFFYLLTYGRAEHAFVTKCELKLLPQPWPF